MNCSDMKLEAHSQSAGKLGDTLSHNIDFNYVLTFSMMMWHYAPLSLTLTFILLVKYELCCAPSISANILLFTTLIIFV